MRLKQITTFYWAAKLGSFVKAAHHLNATQSAVSVRIQQLESRLGTTLFHRAQGAARLTSEGELLLPLAEEVIAATERLLNAARHKEPVEGYVKLGVAEVVALTWLPEFLDALRIDRVDLVGNDSGGGIAQIFAAHHPERVRTLTLTDCDTHDNWPPEAFRPFLRMAAEGGLRGALEGMLGNKPFFRSEQALGPAYEDAARVADETIEAYLRPLVASQQRIRDLERFLAGFERVASSLYQRRGQAA